MRERRLGNRRRRALNVLSDADQRLFLAVMRGDHCVNGFRNTDVANALFPRPAKTTSAGALRRSRTGTRHFMPMVANHLCRKRVLE